MRRRCPCTYIIDAARSRRERCRPERSEPVVFIICPVRCPLNYSGCIYNLSRPLSSELESCRTQSAFLSCKPYCEDSS